MAGGDAPDQLALSAAEQEVGSAVVKRFPFLNGCTALQLPPEVASAPDKVRNHVTAAQQVNLPYTLPCMSHHPDCKRRMDCQLQVSWAASVPC